jgi:hypothetical protein
VREVGQLAKRRLLLIGTAMLLGGVAAIAGSWTVRLAVLASLGLLLVALFGFLVKGQERSTFGELWIAWTLSFAAVPVALASEVSLRITLVVWLSFAFAYCAGIFGVRAIKAAPNSTLGAGFTAHKTFYVHCRVSLVGPAITSPFVAPGKAWVRRKSCR